MIRIQINYTKSTLRVNWSTHVCIEAQNLFYVLFLHLANRVSLFKRELTIPKVPTTILIKNKKKKKANCINIFILQSRLSLFYSTAELGGEELVWCLPCLLCERALFFKFICIKHAFLVLFQVNSLNYIFIIKITIY